MFYIGFDVFTRQSYDDGYVMVVVINELKKGGNAADDADIFVV